MQQPVLQENHLFRYIFITIFSYIYVYLIPWELAAPLEDLLAYIDQINKNPPLGSFSWLDEYFWKSFIYGLSQSNIGYQNYQLALSFVSFTALFIYADFIFKRLNSILSIVVLFNPLFVMLIMSQIRFALAFGLLLIAFQIKSRATSSIFAISSVLFHTVSLFFLVTYFFLKILCYLFTLRAFYIASFIFGLLIAVFIEYGIVFILNFLGDRRVDVFNHAGSSSLKYGLFWLFISLILSFKSKIVYGEKKYILSMSILICSLFFFSTIFGFYGLRFVSLMVPLIAIAINYLPNYYKVIVFYLFICFSIVQWLFTLSILPL